MNEQQRVWAGGRRKVVGWGRKGKYQHFYEEGRNYTDILKPKVKKEKKKTSQFAKSRGNCLALDVQRQIFIE